MISVRTVAAGLFVLASLGTGVQAEGVNALTQGSELRTAVVMNNAALVEQAPDGKYRGLVIELIDALTAKMGFIGKIIPYDNVTRYNLSIGKDDWDIAIGPRDLSRVGQLAFSDPLIEVDNGYVAKAGLSLMAAQDVDRRGIKVAVAQGSAIDGFLTRNLKAAEIVRIPVGMEAAREALRFGQADVYAGPASEAYRLAADVPGSTVLIGRINSVQIVFSLAKTNAAGLSALNDFVASARRDGVIRDLLKNAGLRGVRQAR